MSLLLDALKRAEQEKLAKQGDRPANDAGAPAPAPTPAQSAARRDAANAAALELQPIASAPPPGGAPKAAAAATAQAVFQAKAPAKKPEEGRNLTMLWIIGAVVVVAILGIGGYVWWSLSALQPRPVTTLRTRAVSAPSPTPGQAKLDTLVPGALAPATPPRSDAPSQPLVMPPAAPTPAPASGAAPASAAAIPAPPARVAPDLAARLTRDVGSTPSLKLTPTEKPRVPTDIAAGYEALRAGDLPAARRSYGAALAADPKNVDAHLGAATIEARLGNAAAAASHYRRVLDLDPRNATALAGLASIADMSQPEMLEGQLRADLARYPQSAALHFALGNLYASRGRWEDAQGAFFEALRIEPASSDTLYNLAVAMDHMGQQRLAADYYRRALEAARGQTAQFDPAQVARRLAELRP
jgi:Tfp pilus assembly protein PilF